MGVLLSKYYLLHIERKGQLIASSLQATVTSLCKCHHIHRYLQPDIWHKTMLWQLCDDFIIQLSLFSTHPWPPMFKTKVKTMDQQIVTVQLMWDNKDLQWKERRHYDRNWHWKQLSTRRAIKQKRRPITTRCKRHRRYSAKFELRNSFQALRGQTDSECSRKRKPLWNMEQDRDPWRAEGM